MRRGEVNQRVDVGFHVLDDNLNVPAKFPILTLRQLSLKIIQPTEFIREYTEESDQAIPFLRAANVEDGHLNLDDIIFVDSRKLINAKESFVDPGDILITRTGAKAGATCVVPELSRRYCVSSHSIRVVPRKEKVLPDFLESFLLSKWGKSQITRLFTGAAQKQLQLTTVAKIQIPIPSLDVQQKFVSDLKTAREARKRKLAEADALLAGIDGFLLEQLRLEALEEDNRQVFAIRLKTCLNGRVDALYYAPRFIKLTQALAGSPFTNVPLGEISPEIAGGATPTRGNIELYADGGVKFLRILNVTPFEINLEDVKYVQDAVHEGELGRSQLAANDVLMTITGRVGTAAVVSEEILPANINQHIVRLRIKRNDCLPDYLAAYLNSSIGIALSNRGVTGGTRIALDYETIRNLQIPLPPMPIQQSIAAEITRRREEARRLRAEAAKEWGEAKSSFERQLLGDRT